MDLVQAVARGVSLEQLISGLAVTVPAYRFESLAARAQNLVQKLIQYGNELLAALEKKDAEAVSQMQTRQEGDILKMTIDIYQAQIDEAEQSFGGRNKIASCASGLFGKLKSRIWDHGVAGITHSPPNSAGFIRCSRTIRAACSRVAVCASKG